MSKPTYTTVFEVLNMRQHYPDDLKGRAGDSDSLYLVNPVILVFLMFLVYLVHLVHPVFLVYLTI